MRHMFRTIYLRYTEKKNSSFSRCFAKGQVNINKLTLCLKTLILLLSWSRTTATTKTGFETPHYTQKWLAWKFHDENHTIKLFMTSNVSTGEVTLQSPSQTVASSLNGNRCCEQFCCCPTCRSSWLWSIRKQTHKLNWTLCLGGGGPQF